MDRSRPAAVTGKGFISPDGLYRYWLFRQWAGRLGDENCLFIMLNPSTATATVDDPTIRRCMGFAKREGFNVLEVVNLFAYRATSPADLRRTVDPVGPENDRHLLAAAGRASLVVAAWGALHWRLAWRAAYVRSLLLGGPYRVHCLGRTRYGHPRHPLYVRGDAPLDVWLP